MALASDQPRTKRCEPEEFSSFNSGIFKNLQILLDKARARLLLGAKVAQADTCRPEPTPA